MSSTCFKVVVTAIFVVSCFLLTVSFPTDTGNNTNSTLQFVFVVTRHGSRGPLLHFKTDKYKDSRYWPDGDGALTARGKMEMYKLGQKLHKRYFHLFNGIYSEKVIYVRSTKVARTYMSCAALLAGLFPPKYFQKWNPQINWQPIPIWEDTTDMSDIATNNTACPAFTKEKMIALSRTNDYLVANRRLLDYLSLHSGTPIMSLLDVYTLWDPLRCEADQGLPLPKWAKPVFPKRMRPIASKMFEVVSCGTKKQNQLLSGKLLSDINAWFKKKINGSVTQNMLLHSGHDFTIIGLMYSAGITDNLAVDPASALILELHKNQDGHYVEMHNYNTSSLLRHITPINMPRCPHPCKIDQFMKMTKETEIDGDWTSICNMID